MPTPDDDRDRDMKNLIVAGIVILLIVGSVWLLLAFKKSTEILDCMAAHHPNCVPLNINQDQ
jgi:hypothetical protein